VLYLLSMKVPTAIDNEKLTNKIAINRVENKIEYIFFFMPWNSSF